MGDDPAAAGGDPVAQLTAKLDRCLDEIAETGAMYRKCLDEIAETGAAYRRCLERLAASEQRLAAITGGPQVLPELVLAKQSGTPHGRDLRNVWVRPGTGYPQVLGVRDGFDPAEVSDYVRHAPGGRT